MALKTVAENPSMIYWPFSFGLAIEGDEKNIRYNIVSFLLEKMSGLTTKLTLSTNNWIDSLLVPLTFPRPWRSEDEVDTPDDDDDDKDTADDIEVDDEVPVLLDGKLMIKTLLI